jgi:hypothetical protein
MLKIIKKIKRYCYERNRPRYSILKHPTKDYYFVKVTRKGAPEQYLGRFIGCPNGTEMFECATEIGVNSYNDWEKSHIYNRKPLTMTPDDDDVNFSIVYKTLEDCQNAVDTYTWKRAWLKLPVLRSDRLRERLLPVSPS